MEILQEVPIETHISFPLTCSSAAVRLLRLRCLAKSALLRIEATVSTPPMIAHVLFAHQDGLSQEEEYKNLRGYRFSAQTTGAFRDGHRG